MTVSVHFLGAVQFLGAVTATAVKSIALTGVQRVLPRVFMSICEYIGNYGTMQLGL